MDQELDVTFMQAALREAEKALQKDEVPVGAVAVLDGKIVGRSHNIRERTANPLGHAEILLLQKLSRKFERWRLSDLTFYVTLEPCLMCLGALFQARVGRLVFGASDPKAGACGRIEISKGVLEERCSLILSNFFSGLRRSEAWPSG